MTEETIDAPELDEPEVIEGEAEVVAETTEEVVEEPKSETLPDSSPEEKTKANPFDKRIGELTRKRRDAEREAEYWREQAMKKPVEPPKAEEPLKTLADFDYDESAYQQHLFAKARAEAVEEARRVLKDEQSQQTTQQKIRTFKQKESEFSRKIDDYSDVVTNPNLPITQPMFDVAVEMDNGPEVLYYLGKNPDMAYEIANMSPLAAARELGRIEEKLQTRPKAETVSKAPEPAPKLAAVSPSTQKDVDDMTQEEFNEYRRKQIAKRRK